LGDDEVSWRDLDENPQGAFKKAGFRKIEGYCLRAKADGYAWHGLTLAASRSGAILSSQAIASMFKWYKESRPCYIYLQDVSD